MNEAVLNFEFFKGDFQTHGTYSVTMVAAGTTKFIRHGKTVALFHTKAGDTINSGGSAVAQPIDVTQTFSVEFVVQPTIAGSYIVYAPAAAANGGWTVYVTAGGYVILYLYTSGGVPARQINNSTVFTDYFKTYHFVAVSYNGGTSGAFYTNGALNTTGAGVGTAAIGGNINMYVGLLANLNKEVLIRAWQSAITQEEVSTLYAAYSSLRLPTKV
jgi:hypothetical protein